MIIKEFVYAVPLGNTLLYAYYLFIAVYDLFFFAGYGKIVVVKKQIKRTITLLVLTCV